MAGGVHVDTVPMSSEKRGREGGAFPSKTVPHGLEKEGICRLLHLSHIAEERQFWGAGGEGARIWEPGQEGLPK